jgi:hypothetical protein
MPEGDGNVSDIQSLTLRVQELTEKVDFWNKWILWALAFAAIAAVFLVVTTRLEVVRAKELSIAQKGLSEAQNRQFSLEVAKINEAAAQANEKAESEHLARVKLEKQLAPRTLDASTRQIIGKELSKFAPGFSGRKVKVSSYVADAEGMVFSLEIMDIITKAGIEVEPIIGRIVPVGLVDMGVKVTGPSGDEAFIRSLIGNIHSHLDTALNAKWGPQYEELTVDVGVKPVAGLPALKTK